MFAVQMRKKTMQLRERAISAWQSLRRHHPSSCREEVRTYPTTASTDAGSVRLGLDHEGQLIVLVPVEKGSRLPAEARSSGLNVRMTHYTVGDSNSQFIEIGCPSPALETAFAELADEIVARIEAGSSATKAVSGTIDDFRRLIIRPAQSLISESVITGAIGELIILNTLVEKKIASIDCWTGPHDQRHDFRRGNKAIEVKTTTRWGNTQIHISSIDQLLAPDDGDLMLVHVQLENTPSGPISLSSMCKKLINNGTNAEDLYAALNNLGIIDPHDEVLNKSNYTLKSMNWYLVDSRFPCITSRHLPLPTGVLNITYTVDLSCAHDCMLDESAIHGQLEKFGQDND